MPLGQVARGQEDRAVRGTLRQAIGEMIRADVNGIAYSLPRYALLGATEQAFQNADGSVKPTWQAAWDAIWAIGDDEELVTQGNQLARADIKQFHGQSPEPQTAHLRMLAQMFSGETGIPLGELGLIGDANPTSAEAMMAGKLNVSVECSPLLGPQLMTAVKDVVAGKQVPKRIVTEEGVFPMETAAAEFPKRKY